MIMKNSKQIGFIYKNNESIDKIIQNGEVVFERGFLREKTSTTLPITFGGVGKNLKDYRIYGNTYQNSTSGKNFTYIEPRTSNGITSFYDKETGKISFSGTPTQQWIGIENKHAVSIPAGTYTLSLKESKSFRIIVRYYTDDTNYEEISISANSKSSTKTFSNNIITTQIWIQLVVGTTYNEEFYLQLEEGSVATEFEPYTGGHPSPNPDYPQEIINCGDRTKNLFDKNNGNIINGYIQGNTGKIISGNSDLIAYIKCKPNTQYSFQRIQVKDNKGRFRIGTTQTIPIADMTVENFYYKGNSEYSTNKLDGYTTGANAEYLLFYFSQISGMSQDEIDTILGSIQIEENPIATEYESYYDGYKIPVNVRSENLFKAPESIPNSQRNLATYTKINDNSFSLSYIQNDSTNRSPYVRIDFDVTKLKPNTQYIISKKQTINGSHFANCGSLRTYINGANGAVINGDSLTFSTPSQINSIGIYFYLGYLNTVPGESVITFNEIQLAEGSTTPTKYVPYYNETTNIYLDKPLRKMGNYTDYIDFKRSKIIRNIGEKKLDDTIQWTTGDFNAQKRLYCASNKIDSNMQKVYSNSHKGILMADQYPADTLENILANNIINAVGISSSSYFSIMNQKYASAYEFLQALQAKPVLLLYGLINSVEEDIELPNIPTLDGNNTLNIETEITPSQVYIKYKSNS